MPNSLFRLLNPLGSKQVLWLIDTVPQLLQGWSLDKRVQQLSIWVGATGTTKFGLTLLFLDPSLLPKRVIVNVHHLHLSEKELC
jgi:hypothetical protein